MTNISSQNLSKYFNEKMKIFETEISGDKIGLSVSGGGDSIALLYLMHKWANKNKKKIFVATVDHCLREESANEVKAVKNICIKLNIECEILKWNNWNKGLQQPKWDSNADVKIPVDNSENSKRYYFPW